eukprot:SAG25_NODE_213_length_11711_cov_8.330348_9_plen_154_part_00
MTEQVRPEGWPAHLCQPTDAVTRREAVRWALRVPSERFDGSTTSASQVPRPEIKARTEIGLGSLVTDDDAVQVVAGGVDPCPGHVKRLVVNASGCHAVDPFPPAPAPVPPPYPHASPLTRWIYDFAQNVNGFATLHLPAEYASYSTTLHELFR